MTGLLLNGLARKFYDLAVSEGEGLGTVYEYLVKYKLLSSTISKNEKPKILIAGLPEKYGYSFDFISFCEECDSDYEIVDERTAKIDRLKQIFEKTYSGKVSVQPHNLCALDDIYPQGYFDWALSCEVLQRLSPGGQIEYIKSLKKIATRVILFVPNGENLKHHTSSGLHAISKKALMDLLGIVSDYGYNDIGYIDMPPWPPGVKKNIFRGHPAGEKYNIILNILGIVSLAEVTYPLFVRSRYAHLIYVVF